jgi:hypothetical protein
MSSAVPSHYTFLKRESYLAYLITHPEWRGPTYPQMTYLNLTREFSLWKRRVEDRLLRCPFDSYNARKGHFALGYMNPRELEEVKVQENDVA